MRAHRSGPEGDTAYCAYNPEGPHCLRPFHATGNRGTKVDHGSVEFAVHPPHENELRTQLLDCGGSERTSIGIQVDPNFLRSAKTLQVGAEVIADSLSQV